MNSAAKWARAPQGEGNTDLAHRNEIFRGVGQEGVGLGGALLQEALEFRARKGEAVVDVVREGVHCAHGSLLLWRIPGCACGTQPVRLAPCFPHGPCLQSRTRHKEHTPMRISCCTF